MRSKEGKMRNKWRSYCHTGNRSRHVVGGCDTDRWKHDRIPSAMTVNKYRKGSKRRGERLREDESDTMMISMMTPENNDWRG